MTDSIIVFGRVCPSISQHQEAYRYGDRVILCKSNSERQRMLHGGPFRACIFAKHFNDNLEEAERAFAFAGGASYEDAIRALAKRLHELADGLVREPPPL